MEHVKTNVQIQSLLLFNIIKYNFILFIYFISFYEVVDGICQIKPCETRNAKTSGNNPCGTDCVRIETDSMKCGRNCSDTNFYWNQTISYPNNNPPTGVCVIKPCDSRTDKGGNNYPCGNGCVKNEITGKCNESEKCNTIDGCVLVDNEYIHDPCINITPDENGICENPCIVRINYIHNSVCVVDSCASYDETSCINHYTTRCGLDIFNHCRNHPCNYFNLRFFLKFVILNITIIFFFLLFYDIVCVKMLMVVI
jgi:hypothetical protein